MDDQDSQGAKAPRIERTSSEVTSDGRLIEQVYDRAHSQSCFAVYQSGRWWLTPSVDSGDNRRIVPFSADNDLIKTGSLVLPSRPEEYGSERELINEIQSYIHRYVDLSPAFERLASYYVLLTWVYDAFNEVPYLRVRGDYGTGKTRFLLVVGALCYKAFFASGASTVSPIFHTLDAFRGTLVIDEADFRFSDEKADVIKILNNGNVRGMPVLRTMTTRMREYSPKAFHVFGPKLVATRGEYQDPALESRCLTEEMGRAALRADIPINLPTSYAGDALRLRNKLLLYRMRNFHRAAIDPSLNDHALEPRINQIFTPLKSIVANSDVRGELAIAAQNIQASLTASRGFELETQLLEVIRDLIAEQPGVVSVKAITAAFTERYGSQYENLITNQWVGGIVRRKLHVSTMKSNGIYVIPISELPRLKVLFAKFGIESTGTSAPNPPTSSPKSLHNPQDRSPK